MSAKIILYDRENYKQARKNVLLYNFSDVLLSENLLDFCRNYHGANFPFLNYPYIFAPRCLNDCKREFYFLRRAKKGVNKFYFSWPENLYL